MARIYTRPAQGKTIYYIDYQVHGRRIRKRMGTQKKVAEYALADIISKLERHEVGLPSSDKPLGEFIQEYLAWCQKNKPDSYNMEKRILKLLMSLLGRNRIKDVTEQDIEKFKTVRKDQGIKNSSINREMNTIKAAFNKAVSLKYIPISPAKDVKKLKSSKPSFRYLSNEEIKKLLAFVTGKKKLIFMTYLYTGLRRSELIYLDWKDVNLENKFISVTPKEDWHPKDFEVRHIPINAPLLVDLKKCSGTPDQVVFSTRRGQRYIPSALSREIGKLYKKAGIKGADIRTLRHSFASHLVMSGTDLYTVQKLLGHSSVKTTERYAHLAPDFLHTAVGKLKF